MLIEVKVKVARIIDGKTRKRTETYVLDKAVFADAEYQVMAKLAQEQEDGCIDGFEIQGLKISQIKEIANQFDGQFTYMATLKDIWLDEAGNEKALRYKVLLDADDLADAQSNIQQLARQGYDMQVEGIKQVDYEYLSEQSNQEEEETENE